MINRRTHNAEVGGSRPHSHQARLIKLLARSGTSNRDVASVKPNRSHVRAAFAKRARPSGACQVRRSAQGQPVSFVVKDTDRKGNTADSSRENDRIPVPAGRPPADATKRVYDDLDRLFDASTALALYGHQTFEYDGVGNRELFTDNAAKSVLTYDTATPSNRCTDDHGTGAADFDYDEMGNITTYDFTGCAI